MSEARATPAERLPDFVADRPAEWLDEEWRSDREGLGLCRPAAEASARRRASADGNGLDRAVRDRFGADVAGRLEDGRA